MADLKVIVRGSLLNNAFWKGFTDKLLFVQRFIKKTLDPSVHK